MDWLEKHQEADNATAGPKRDTVLRYRYLIDRAAHG